MGLGEKGNSSSFFIFLPNIFLPDFVSVRRQAGKKLRQKDVKAEIWEPEKNPLFFHLCPLHRQAATPLASKTGILSIGLQSLYQRRLYFVFHPLIMFHSVQPMTEWKIQSRGNACGGCGKTFADRESYHTVLFDDKTEFSRSDICQNCWQNQYNEGVRDRKGFISHWQGIYEEPLARPEPIQRDTAESLLRKLIEQNDPRYAAAAYILAVMLERKRALKVKEQILSEGRRIFIYEQPGTGDIFTITDPNLQLNQLEQVQHEVAALLEHGLNPVPAPEPCAVAAAEPSSVVQ
jgi:hypothetical protein